MRALRSTRPWRSACRRGIGSALAIGIGISAVAATCSLLVPSIEAGASQTTQKTVQRTSLCSAAGAVTRLVVRRTDAFPEDHFRFSFPSSIDVQRSPAVRTTARALCALPVMPRQELSCPIDFGITYHLQFSRAHERFRVVTLDATGCETVQGLARARWIARSPHFWHVLGTAMRLKSPSWTTFRGTGPKG